MTRFRFAAILAILGTTWGVTLPLTKIAVSTGHQALGLIFWQFVIGSFILGVIALVRWQLPVINRRTLFYYLMIGLLGTILPNSFSFVAIAHLPAGVIGVVIASVPMFTLTIALLLGLEVPSMKRGLGVLLGAIAVLLLIGPETSLPDPDKVVYVLIALVAPFCYGLEGNYIAKWAPQEVDPVSTLLGASILGSLIMGPVAVATDSWVELFVPWEGPEWALLFSSIFHVTAYTGYIWLVGVAGAVFSSQIAYVVTIAAVFLSALILSETYSVWVWSALALMMLGLSLVQPRADHQPLIQGSS
jgi:drug/metabolite transporter (DMT)-like permease